MRLSAARAAFALASVFLGLGLGCASLSAGTERYAYFTLPAFDDAWSAKIEGWQRRERADRAAPATAPAAVAGGDAVAGGTAAPEAPASELGTDLRAKYEHFLEERKRQMARDVAAWIQGEARYHYRADGPVDHWATLEETLRRGGDDCDGLELLTFHALRDLGFADDEVYRAIVYRPQDGQHHMVTLWFESPDDPWVIDPTGAMTLGMPRMSERPDWVPLKVFSDTVEFTVRRASGLPGGLSALAANEAAAPAR